MEQNQALQKRKKISAKANASNDFLLTTNGLGNPKLCQNVKLSDSWSGDYNKGVWQFCESATKCKKREGVPSATTWLVQGEGTYVLESQEFKMETESVLRFQYQFVEKSFTSKLRMCLDTLDVCPFVKRGSSQEEKWEENITFLTPGLHKIYFTVTNLKKTDHIKVRRINVSAKDGDGANNCTLKMTLIDE